MRPSTDDETDEALRERDEKFEALKAANPQADKATWDEAWAQALGWGTDESDDDKDGGS